jgi:hypothetical protein
MKKSIYFLVFLLILGMTFMLFTSCNTNNKIYIDESKSFFSDYEVLNDKVFIKCYVTLTNSFDIEKTVKLSARLPEDVTIGLLKKDEVKVLNEDGSEEEFVLSPNVSNSFASFSAFILS